MPDPDPSPVRSTNAWQPRDRSYDDVAVAPRYLAGYSGTGDDAFVPLTHHYWHAMYDEFGNFYATTMDSQLRVAFVPEHSELLPDATALWQIRARRDPEHSPVWTAAFTDETPPEIIAGVTAALNADVAASRHDDHPYLDRNDHPGIVWDVLRAAGWDVTAMGFNVRAVSPDRLASLSYQAPSASRRLPPGEAWRAVIQPDPGAHRPLWEADFHTATPAHILAAFATALTDPAPLTRERAVVPAPCRSYAAPLAHQDEPKRTPTPLDLRAASPSAIPNAAATRVAWSTSTPPRHRR